MLSARAQIIMIWWALIFYAIFGAAWWQLLGMLPPPAPTLTPTEVAAFYTENSFRIKLGAAVASWTSAFMVPFSTVAAIQLSRLEKGTPAWSILSFAGGILMSIFIVLPPLFWGVAAFNPGRLADATSLMNDLANLSLTTTDQFFIFQMIPIAIVSLTNPQVPHSAFPRWLGWFTVWAAIIFEVGVLGYMFKTGPFAWNGLIVFWLTIIIFGIWVLTTSVCMLRALKRQASDI